MKRREFLQLSFGTAAAAALSSRARAEAAPKEIRIGTQKGGFFPAVRQRHTVEDVFRPLGIEIKWIDFQFGPPLLEAINVGSVDSATLAIRRRSSRRRRAPGSAMSQPSSRTGIPGDHRRPGFADQDGRRSQGQADRVWQGFNRAQSLVAALEKAGLAWSDITPAPLAPANATAAFVKGSVDAWSIWDPYLAFAELKDHARVVAFDKDVHKPNAFYIAGSDFVEKYPALVARLNNVFASEGVWADRHHEDVAKAQADATGVDIEAVRRFVDRSNSASFPSTTKLSGASRRSPTAFHGWA